MLALLPAAGLHSIRVPKESLCCPSAVPLLSLCCPSAVPLLSLPSSPLLTSPCACPTHTRLFLIRHMDDLDDIYGVLLRLGDMKYKIARQEFALLLTEALGRDRALSTTSINLLYKMYCNQKKDELQVSCWWRGM